jgi:hypothetical protein
LSAVAGDCGSDYRPLAGGGVHALDESGYLIETMGTSLSAPLLAREAALAFDYLERNHRPPDGRVFAVTVKAFLAATARLANLPVALSKLAARTLGRGSACSAFIESPSERSARFVWQGFIPSRSQKVRVQLPVPRSWLGEAARPQLRIVCATDTPVHASALETWASRKVNIALFTNPERDGETEPAKAQAQRPKGSSRRIGDYPLFDRGFDLKRHIAHEAPESDFWIVQLDYKETEAGYRPGPEPNPRQRVAFVAELWDEAEGASPQPFVQALGLELALLSSCVVESPIAVSVPA